MIVERCYAGLDADQLRTEVLARLRGVLTVDAAFFATVDPATILFTSAYADEPLGSVTEQFIANEFGQDDVNKFAALAGGATPVRSLAQATKGDWRASPRYADVMRPLGLGDELRAALRSNGQCWGVLCLHREDGRTGFSQQDLEVVRRIAPHLGEGLRRALRARPVDGGGAGPGVVLLDDRLHLESLSAEAEYWFEELGSAHQLPVSVRSVAARMQLEQVPVRLKVRARSGQWLELYASRLGTAGRTAVVIEPVPPAQLGSLLLQLHGLTPAQQRVTELVLRGWSTRQIVDELCLSPHTVQEHVRAAFDKVGVGSRRELVNALLRGSASP